MNVKGHQFAGILMLAARLRQSNVRGLPKRHQNGLAQHGGAVLPQACAIEFDEQVKSTAICKRVVALTRFRVLARGVRQLGWVGISGW